MVLIQILLPLYDNEKRIFSRNDYETVRHELAERYGGVTAFLRSPADGIWHKNAAEVHKDEIVMIEVMVPEFKKQDWKTYRHELETRFRQDEIVIRALSMERV